MGMIENQKILDAIEQALIAAPCEFERIANGDVPDVNWCADRMPESWVVSLLMQALSELGLAAFPEMRVNHDLKYFEVNGKSLSLESLPGLQGAKIDLFVADKSECSEQMRFRAALEVKANKSAWGSLRRDLERLAELKTVANGENQQFIFAYVSAPLSEATKIDHDEKLCKSMGLPIEGFKILPARTGCVCSTEGRSYIYLVIC